MVNPKNKTVFIAMSGGVDSSVAAALLKKAGFRVVGVHMKCWSEELSKACTATDDERMARLAASHLGIPFYVWNFIDEYKKRVVDYMLEGYERGITPNPDMMCNKEIKFGLFFEKAISLGADYVATGHYAQIQEMNGAYTITKAKDDTKDQSYFLSSIKPEVLSKTLFPIGKYLKKDVRSMAQRIGLPNAYRKDSQGICFVGNIPLDEFLEEYIPSNPGPIVDMQGNVLGQHKGVSYYTIGQRKGLGLAGGPYYIADKDKETNTLVVSTNEEDIKHNTVLVKNAHWFVPVGAPQEVRVKLRYRQKEAPAVLEQGEKEDSYVLRFQDPQRAIAPGQFAAFYIQGMLVGNGVIVGADSLRPVTLTESIFKSTESA